MSDGHLVALWSAAFSVFHVNRSAGSKYWPQLQSRLSNGLARETSLMVMLTNDPAPRYVEKTGCGLRRLRDAIGFQQLDSTRNHAGTDPWNAQMG
jgi:ribosomal protein S18 acetylase RimI-like enzyme